ncbi:SGNH/GDSL hydrolase family protein [uncultured Winogradskyella sp.]|uniref:SGNH/GDSL hydrolase family protein n=1 Tax=uncultured Winogradskyella sp. TaxID=395353 RepID=UPI002606E3E5|nr:SGNH/GDSL hydrolase family protein [uncultured Winogradskyella sp.]
MRKAIKYILFLIFIFVISSGCNENSHQTNVEKDHYNINNIKPVFDLGNYTVKYKKNKIIFSKEHGNISSPVQYNNLKNEFNFNSIYRFKDSLQNAFFFRFGWVSFKENQSVLSNIEWIGKAPQEFEDFKKINFKIVDIDFIQFGTTSLCTIGDSQTWWSNAQNLRKYINDTNENLIFVGSNTDIFGYGHEGEGGNNSSELLNRIDNIPSADFYTLLLGTNDWKNNIETTFINITKITEHLTLLNPKAKILYLTPIPTTNKKRDLFNIDLSKKLIEKFKENKQIIVLDLRKKILDNENWEKDYLSHDGLHQNKDGVEFTAKSIGNKIIELNRN